jgi:hypothetical protein
VVSPGSHMAMRCIFLELGPAAPHFWELASWQTHVGELQRNDSSSENGKEAMEVATYKAHRTFDYPAGRSFSRILPQVQEWTRVLSQSRGFLVQKMVRVSPKEVAMPGLEAMQDDKGGINYSTVSNALHKKCYLS